MANTSLVGGVPDDVFVSRAEQAAQLAEDAQAAAEAAQAAAEAALAATLAALAAQLIEEHADTTVAGKAAGDVLFWNGSAWVNQPYVVGDITNVDLTGLNTDDLLTWNGTNWVPIARAAASGDFLPLTGGTLTGALTLPGAPTNPLEAATKAYVDSIPASTPLYILSTWTEGLTTADQLIFAHVVTDSFSFAADMLDSIVEAGTAATAQTDFDLQKNGVSFGTVRFAAAGTVATYVGVLATSFVAGDEIEMIGPTVPDTTLADLRVSLRGLR